MTKRKCPNCKEMYYWEFFKGFLCAFCKKDWETEDR
jgi:uncharacterized Zn ribbon protein